MLWCRTACGYMWITRSPSTYPQKSRRRWRAGPRPASVAPMNDYEPLPGEPTATMFQSLEQIRRQTLQRCTATVGQSDRQLLFGMTTALELQGVPMPSRCNLDTAALHVTVRMRSGRPHIRPLKSVPVIVHIWSHCTPQSLIHISNGAPDADKLYLELQRFIKEMPPFRGKSICRQAMTLVRPMYGLPPKARYGWAFNATEYRMDDAMSWFLESPFVQEQPFRWTSHGSSSRSEWNMTAIIIERIRSSGAETTKKGNGYGPTAGY